MSQSYLFQHLGLCCTAQGLQKHKLLGSDRLTHDTYNDALCEKLGQGRPDEEKRQTDRHANMNGQLAGKMEVYGAANGCVHMWTCPAAFKLTHLIRFLIALGTRGAFRPPNCAL